MAEGFIIRHRKSRRTPMKSRRFGDSLHAGGAVAAAADFPGLDLDDPEHARGRAVSSGLSVLFHGLLLALLFLTAYLAPEIIEEQLIEVKRIEEEVAREEPAPRPRVVQERASPRFDPSRMALAPQVQNPVVINKAAPAIQAPQIDVQTVNPVQAPREVPRAVTSVAQVRRYQSRIQVSADPVRVEGSAPAIRGPIEHEASAGIQSGPRQVAAAGNTVGIANPQALGSGSNVREGMVTGRDVLGAKTGVRADVNWAVGDSLKRGTGGSGSGPGGVSSEDCLARPEVRQYMGHIKSRVMDRWALPAGVSANQAVELRFELDPAGTARRVDLVKAGDNKLGQSAVDAFRSASPFNNMSDRVRCLAGHPILATFRNPVSATN